MGAEGSKLESDDESFNPYAGAIRPKAPPEPPAEQQASPGSGRPSSVRGRISQNGTGQKHLSEAQKKALEKSKENKVWMLKNQVRVSSPTDIRRGSPPSAGPRRYGNATSPVTLESQMGALLKTEQQVEQTFEQKVEEKKTEFIGKLNTFIKRSGSKPPVDMNVPKVAILPPKMAAIPAAAHESWLGKLMSSKAEVLEKIKDRLASEPVYEPMTQDGVGEEVEKSLGSTYETFAGYQGTINHMVEAGLTEDLLNEFIMDEEAERQLTTYEKWAVVRHAAEQVLQVYANRSNARWLEAENWDAPHVVDANHAAASVYASAVDGALNQGNVALLFIDDGRLVEVGDAPTDIAALLSTDLWQAIKQLAPNRVPSSQRLERLSILGRHLLHAAVSVEMWYGANALKNLKVVVAVDSEQEHFTVSELQQWSFFGLNHEHVVVLPLPRFHGFANDMKRGVLAHVKGSPRLMLGTGYAMFLLNSPAEAYTLDAAGQNPSCLQGTVLDWLRDHKAGWLYGGLFSDVARLRPEAMFDADFLAAALYAVDRTGANMAMEVVHGDGERDVRAYDSIVLSRGHAPPGSEGGAGGGGGAASNCNLRASAMRTVRSYQIMQAQVANPHGFYVATHRYAFKVSTLQRLLVDAMSFHADVKLHGYYAYAMFDMADLTTFPTAQCAAVLSGGAHGPPQADVVYGRAWLAQAASILEAQDKVNEFRQKAIELVKTERLTGSGATAPGVGGVPIVGLEGRGLGRIESVRPQSAAVQAMTGRFKENKKGFQVVLLLAPEHRALARSALKLARLWVRNIVDRLHVVLIMSSQDSKDVAKAVLDEVTDKELEFNGQLSKEVAMRSPDTRILDTVQECCDQLQAGLVVVPSIKLCGPPNDLGASASSLALLIARNVTTCPVLIFKANTSGRYASPNPGTAFPPAQREFVTAMAHLDSTTVSPMVEAVSSLLNPSADVLFLAKTLAYERPGQLAMRARRMFVQARMAVTGALRCEERAYAGSAVPELCKAVDVENVDVLVVSAAGELHISKETEELLKTARAALLIHRNKEVVAAPTRLGSIAVVEEAPAPAQEGYHYGRR